MSEIGLGTWTMGGMWGAVDDPEALRAISRALELGVNFIDTAHVYGDGHSERLIANALAGRKEAVFIATKVPPKNLEWPAGHDTPAAEAFPSDWIIRCTEESLKRLNRKTIDLQQLHVWSPGWLNESSVWLPAIEQLKKAGKIRAFGISINDHEPDSALELAASGLIDSVQVIYNIFDQTPAERLFPVCEKHHVAVIARVPFDEGSLTGKFSAATHFETNDWRVAYFAGDRLKETVEHVRRIGADFQGNAHSLGQLALSFCLAQPAVSTVIPGMRKVAHVEDNCAVGSAAALTKAEVARLKAHAWPRNFYKGVFS